MPGAELMVSDISPPKACSASGFRVGTLWFHAWFNIHRMAVIPPEMTADEVLGAFHRDAPYLFLGAAFVAVGFVSAAFAAIRRKHDSLLIYFTLFAVLYGLRLWIQSSLLGITMHDWSFYIRLRSGINYIILVPAFLFLGSLGIPTRVDRILAFVGVSVGIVLTLATCIFGPSSSYDLTNKRCGDCCIDCLGFFEVHPRQSRRRG